MTISVEALRRQANDLKKSFRAGEAHALARLRAHPPRNDDAALKHADFLHVVAQENNFASWPALKLAAATTGLDRAAQVQRLKVALFHGQNRVVAHLLARTPDLAAGTPGLQIALYDRRAAEQAIAADPSLATRQLGPRSAILHLAFSKYIHQRPDLEGDMLAIADLLLANGADVNDAMPASATDARPLSALYGALVHADNMPLARWLLENGANPNDGESLYHATEPGHHEGLDLLLAHGADPAGTNALLRAMDFNDHTAVRKLLAAGAVPQGVPGGDPHSAIPVLHHAARRMCDAATIDLLLGAGADPARIWQGSSVYGFARVHGNKPLVRALEARGMACPLDPAESLLAQAADGVLPSGSKLPRPLPDIYRNLIREILPLPGKLPHIQALVALGLNPDQPDAQGLTPIQIAGWEGLADIIGYLLTLGPDLDHVNSYGGTLLTTILHGADNAPDRAGRDYIDCLRLALQAGVALPRRVIGFTEDEEVAAFLADWASAHPEQVAAGA